MGLVQSVEDHKRKKAAKEEIWSEVGLWPQTSTSTFPFTTSLLTQPAGF